MRITIVGATGFIGGRLARSLSAAGHKLLAPSRDEIAALPPREGRGTVVWAAGLTSDFRARPLDTVDAHVADLSRMLRNGGVDALVYLSSTRVYEHCAETSERAMIGVRPDVPSDLYNLSKLMGESLCLSSGISRVALARLSNVVGPREGCRNTFLGALCREARNGKIVLQSAPGSAKDYVWIDDVVRGLVELATGATTGIVNLASGRQVTHATWSDAIAQALGAAVEVDSGASLASFPPIDVERFDSLIGAGRIDPLSRLAEIIQT